jgi:hypothetical protein
MSSLLVRIANTLAYRDRLLAEAKEQLAQALANDASDAETIRLANESAAQFRAAAEASEAVAQSAQARVSELEQTLSENTAQFTAISDLIAPYEPPAEPIEEPPVDPAEEGDGSDEMTEG